ncbi:MAG: uroporphyrinogen-III C-methyltransferase [Rickettsiales bacterium]|nr:uroporphyrinogen-III C-methyltransferase [Pseudomonadota bacterium]MDA0966301.1 uroporphyrinogen-III C-methyltransferase [Pseudomonadota bacterium]MDG4543034.1 uroporphyrinogen-III C-methyltransferase [Rickettsiales bacterium]MDG4545232.1 uroporphyrinogen-III C-methyltransferase [Rickettsiales bacterium]MDG4547681.1 uroporphyrinogen-III C-methyltransferase [Rickettsiales bacterium]
MVGAGPGDAGLLTVKAFCLINEIADIVIYDRLISEEILSLIPDSVERIYAGKSCRKHVMTQDEINSALVAEAKKGKIVVRLKGGDPFIFGRGGEEVEYLIQHDIPFEVVPGVNAADGCSAYCGVPLTHRGLATGVRFVTGHKQKGEEVNLDWKGLACPDTTLVLYMGLTNLDGITDNLIKNGLDKDTPAVAIQEGTTKNQRSCFSTLENIYKDACEMDLKPPTLVIVGKVVGLSAK